MHLQMFRERLRQIKSLTDPILRQVGFVSERMWTIVHENKSSKTDCGFSRGWSRAPAFAVLVADTAVCVCVCASHAVPDLCKREKGKGTADAIRRSKQEPLKLNQSCSLAIAIACNRADAAVCIENRSSFVDEVQMQLCGLNTERYLAVFRTCLHMQPLNHAAVNNHL